METSLLHSYFYTLRYGIFVRLRIKWKAPSRRSTTYFTGITAKERLMNLIRRFKFGQFKYMAKNVSIWNWEEKFIVKKNARIETKIYYLIKILIEIEAMFFIL